MPQLWGKKSTSAESRPKWLPEDSNAAGVIPKC